MNATEHSKLSARNRGGKPEDYYALHDFMDWSKELESSNKHRGFSHHMFWVKEVVIPIFGHTIINSDGKEVNVKDMLETDHLLSDYSNRFIPTLRDYTDLVTDDAGDKELIAEFDRANESFYKEYPQVRTLMLAPLGITGQLKALLVTHNSWFVTRILPLVFKDVKIEVRDFNISPSVFFNRMRYADWIQNGHGAPPSFAKINEYRKAKSSRPKQVTADMVLDGGHLKEGKRISGGVLPLPTTSKPKINLVAQGSMPELSVTYDGSPKPPRGIEPSVVIVDEFKLGSEVADGAKAAYDKMIAEKATSEALRPWSPEWWDTKLDDPETTPSYIHIYFDGSSVVGGIKQRPIYYSYHKVNDLVRAGRLTLAQAFPIPRSTAYLYSKQNDAVEAIEHNRLIELLAQVQHVDGGDFRLGQVISVNGIPTTVDENGVPYVNESKPFVENGD